MNLRNATYNNEPQPSYERALVGGLLPNQTSNTKTSRKKPTAGISGFKTGKIPKHRKASRSANGRRPSRDLTEELAKHAAELPRLPKRKLRDISELSFGRRKQKPRRKPKGPSHLEMAASPAQRTRVADTKVVPFRKVCDLLITARDGTLGTGTAWFISPRTLVTAGHCIAVFRPGTAAHGLVSKILVMPARNGETTSPPPPFSWVEIQQENLRVHDGWRLNGNLDFDFGAIILPPNLPLGNILGVFGFGDFTDPVLLANKPILSGYPDDVPEGTQWFERNSIKRITPARIFYDIFTFGGQSGSPVFFADATKQVACGIHDFGDTPFNSGVRINPAVVAQLNAWKV